MRILLLFLLLAFGLANSKAQVPEKRQTMLSVKYSEYGEIGDAGDSIISLVIKRDTFCNISLQIKLYKRNKCSETFYVIKRIPAGANPENPENVKCIYMLNNMVELPERTYIIYISLNKAIDYLDDRYEYILERVNDNIIARSNPVPVIDEYKFHYPDLKRVPPSNKIVPQF